MEAFRKVYHSIFEATLLEDMLTIGTFKKLKEGEFYVRKDGFMTGIPLVISGALKILRENHDGHLVLYFIKAGETCSISLSNNQKRLKSEICSVAQLDTTLLILPKDKLDVWMCAYSSWQAFVNNTYRKRIHTLLEVIDSFAFFKKEDRVLLYLEQKAAILQTNILKYNHQQIADELYSSRVVVSRLLKKLEDRGKLKLGRNSIEIV